MLSNLSILRRLKNGSIVVSANYTAECILVSACNTIAMQFRVLRSPFRTRMMIKQYGRRPEVWRLRDGVDLFRLVGAMRLLAMFGAKAVCDVCQPKKTRQKIQLKLSR